MVWKKISGSVIQFHRLGDTFATNYYIKFYAAGTSTEINMATDSTGGTQLAKAKYGSDGTIETDGGSKFIPHLDQNYKFSIYENSTNADSNSNPVLTIDNLKIEVTTYYSNVAAAVADVNLNVGDIIETLGYYSSGDGGENRYEVVASATGTVDGGSFIDLTGVTGQLKGLFPADRISVPQFGTKGDGTTDDSTAIQNALDYGASLGFRTVSVYLPMPDTSYYIETTLNLPTNARLYGDGESKILVSASNAIVGIKGSFNSNPNRLVGCDITGLFIESDGAKSDGLSTIGIDMGSAPTYNKIRDVYCSNFSSHGIYCNAGVYNMFYDIEANNCEVGFNMAGSVNAFWGCYITDCETGLALGGNSQFAFFPVVETSGDSSNSKGAYQIGGYDIVMIGAYAEANNINRVYNEGRVLEISGQFFSATNADSISYSGTDQSLRGISKLLSNDLRVPRINADSISNRDLTIGENIKVPVSGGSNQFGAETQAESNGTLSASGVWETVHTFTDQTGDNRSRKSHRYAVYLGISDKQTGFDSGVILNQTLYSDTGSTPSWIQLSGDNLQLQTAATTYGLNWGLSLTSAQPGLNV